MPLFILVFILTTFLTLTKTFDVSGPFGFAQAATWPALGWLALLPASVLAPLLFTKKRVHNDTEEVDPKSYRHLDLIAHLSWFAGVIFLMTATRWPRWAESLSYQSKAIQLLVAMSPGLVSLFLLWAAASWKTTRSLSRCWHDANCRCKVHVLMILTPMVFILIIRDICFQFETQQSFAVQLTLFVTGLMLLSVLLPRMVCWILPTHSIKQTDLGDELSKIAEQTGTRVRDIRIWGTGNRLMNALVVGMLPFSRSVLLSDLLIRKLELDEIQSVFLHEIGHAHRHHLFQRFAAAGFPFVLTIAIGELGQLDRTGTLFLAMFLAMAGLTVIARLLEYDADRFAVRRLQMLGIPSSAYRRALSKILAENPRADRHSWLHPRISERIKRVESLTLVPIDPEPVHLNNNSMKLSSGRFRSTGTIK